MIDIDGPPEMGHGLVELTFGPVGPAEALEASRALRTDPDCVLEFTDGVFELALLV